MEALDAIDLVEEIERQEEEANQENLADHGNTATRKIFSQSDFKFLSKFRMTKATFWKLLAEVIFSI